MHKGPYCQTHDLFSTQQFGFIKGRSTVLQLLKVMEIWTHALDNGHAIDTIYLDFMKAFHTVPHRRLIGTLESIGIHGQIVSWVQDFLSNRVQQVNVNGTKSDRAKVISGIPQGSVLGPILFVLYINDLPNNISSDVFMFADDTKVFRIIERHEDQTLLQDDLDKLSAWSSKWLLNFHPDKCKLLSMGPTDEDNVIYELNTGDNSYELGLTVEETDIGVIIDPKLEFDRHMQMKINKASSIMAVIRRSFITLNTANFTFQCYHTRLISYHTDY